MALFTAAEIKAANGNVDFNSTIDAFDWDRYTGTGGYTAGNGQCEIWVKTTALANVVTADTWGNFTTGATMVYSSVTQNINTSAGYQRFTLGTPFAYNTASGSNLLVMVKWYRPSAWAASTNWRYTSTSATMQRYFYSTTAIGASTSIAYGTTVRPNIKITHLVPYDHSLTKITTTNQTGLVGSVVNYQVRITNGGTNSDSYNLGVSGNSYSTRILNAVGGSVISNTGTLAPGATFDAYVEVTIGSSALVDPVTVTATSVGGAGTKSVSYASGATRAYVNAMTSLQAGSGVTYSWIDPVAGGHTDLNYTSFLVGSSCDDAQLNYTLQEAFHFGGTVVSAGSTIGIGTNGNIGIGGVTGWGTYNYGISAYVRDLGASAAQLSPVVNHIYSYYDAAAHQTIITWKDWPAYSAGGWTGATYSFQVIINHLTSDIKVQYNDLNALATDASYGTYPRVGIVSGASAGTVQLNVVASGSKAINALYGGGNIAEGVAILMTQLYPSPFGFTPANGANPIPLNQQLSWSAPGQTTADVYFGTDNPPPLAQAGLAATTYNPGALTSGVTYYWKVVSHYAAQMDNTSSVMSFTTVNMDTPADPTTGSVGNASTSSVDVTWTDGSTNEDWFVVYVATPTFPGGFDPSTATPNATLVSSDVAGTGAVLTHTITGLDPNNAYSVRVYALNDNTVGMRAPSNSGNIIRAVWQGEPRTMTVRTPVVREGEGAKSVIEYVETTIDNPKARGEWVEENGNVGTMSMDALYYSAGFASGSGVTLAAVPGTPSVTSPNYSTMVVTPANNGTTANPSTTTYAIHETSTGNYVQANGTLGVTAVWQTLATWGSKTVTGLTVGGITYTFEVKARNSASIETGFSGTASGTTLAPPATTWEYAATISTPPAISDMTTTTVSLNIPSSFAINYIAAKINITHTYVGDLLIKLAAPNHDTLVLSNRRGSGGDNFTNTVFTDASSSSITTIPSTGSYTGNYTAEASFNLFAGDNAQGTWTLIVYDGASGDVGTINAFSLIFDNFINAQSNGNGEGSQLPFVPTFPPDPNTGGQSPLEITFPAQTGGNSNPGSVTAYVHTSRPAGVNAAALPPATTLNRFWDIHSSTSNFVGAVLRLRFTTADLPAGITDPMTANPPLTAAYSNDGGSTWTPIYSFTIADLGGGVWELVISGLNHFSLWGLGNGGQLPVELTSFTASAGDNRVSLNWRTETETNNSQFRVYRSEFPNARGNLIATVAGANNSATAHTYRVVDTDARNNVTYYYRLSDVDVNGVEVTHTLVATATPRAGLMGDLPTEFSLSQNFPNPFNPETEIRYSLKENSKVELKVFDLNGREVATLVNGLQARSSYTVKFDGSKLAAGVYFYQLRANDYSEIRKMVLVK